MFLGSGTLGLMNCTGLLRKDVNDCFLCSAAFFEVSRVKIVDNGPRGGSIKRGDLSRVYSNRFEPCERVFAL